MAESEKRASLTVCERASDDGKRLETVAERSSSGNRSSLEPGRGSVIFVESSVDALASAAPAPVPSSRRPPPPPIVLPSKTDSSDAPTSPRPPPPDYPHSPRTRPPVPKASPRDMLSPLNSAVFESLLVDCSADFSEVAPAANNSNTIAARRRQKVLAELRVDRSNFLTKLNVKVCPLDSANHFVVVNFGGDVQQVFKQSFVVKQTLPDFCFASKLTRTLENNPLTMVVHGSGATSLEEVAFFAIQARKNISKAPWFLFFRFSLTKKKKVFEFFVQNKDLSEVEAIEGVLNILFRNSAAKLK